MLCVLFLEGIVFRPYRRGHEAYRLIVPVLLGSGAVELLAADLLLWGTLLMATAVTLLLAFSRPVGVRGMFWSVRRDRSAASAGDPDTDQLSVGQNLLLLVANAVGMALGVMGPTS